MIKIFLLLLVIFFVIIGVVIKKYEGTDLSYLALAAGIAGVIIFILFLQANIDDFSNLFNLIYSERR